MNGIGYDTIIKSMCSEYHALFLVKYPSGQYESVYVPERYLDILCNCPSYSEGLNRYCDKYVSDKDRELLRYMSDIEIVAGKLRVKPVHEIIYQSSDYKWRTAKYIAVKNDDTDGEMAFLFGVAEFDSDMQEYQRTRRVNEIVNSFSESYQIIYRANVHTGAYEVLLCQYDSCDYIYRLKDIFELEKYSREYFVDEKYVEDMGKQMSAKSIREHFLCSKDKMEYYFKDKRGTWMKLQVTRDADYTYERPYVIYAYRECNDYIELRTTDMVNRAALSKMFVLTMTVDVNNDVYNCYHVDNKNFHLRREGRFSEFMEFMQDAVFGEDFPAFQSLFKCDPDSKGFTEREYRAEDVFGMAHFYNAFSTNISLPDGDRILILIRNIDERAANRARIDLLHREYDKTKNILFALGEAYYALYYISFDTDSIQNLRLPEDMYDIVSSAEGVDGFVKMYTDTMVIEDDRDKVSEFISQDFISKSLKQKGQRTFCEFQRLFGKEYRWVRMDIQAIKLKKGKIAEAVYAIKDIHEEREAELRYKKELHDALVAAELASDSKTNFLSNVSHDIRTPMNAILGMAELAINHIGDSNKVYNCLDKITVAGKHLQRLINEVLDMSYIESGKIILNEINFRLPELFHSLVMIVEHQAKTKHLDFRIEAKNIKNENVVSDRVRLNQIFLNILSNAIKYTEEYGSVHMTVEQLDEGNGQMGMYRIIVEDNGIGMTEEFAERIFLPFERETDYTDKAVEGSGLGMAITKKLVDLMKGTITLKTKLGVGTTFVIDIPLKLTNIENRRNITQCLDDYTVVYFENDKVDVVKEVGAAVASDSSKPVIVVASYDITEIEEEAKKAGMSFALTEPVFESDFDSVTRTVDDHKETEEMFRKQLEGKKILVVDDNIINIDIAGDFLGDIGAVYDSALNGEEAYNKILADNSYDAILMDVRMPVLNGYDATRKIRGIGTKYALNIPIIAMTANAFAEDVLMSKQAGMNDHISKPVDSEILYSVLSRCLSQNSDT